MLVIGITGGSGSGKTTVVNEILKHFSPNQVSVLHMDCYYKDLGNLPQQQRQQINFDHPDSIEFDLLVKHLETLISRQPAEEPTYDFIRSARNKETVRVNPANVLIVEGILIFDDERIRDLCNVKVFVDAEPDERLIRIMRRDVHERGRTVDAVLERYAVIKNMHIRFIEHTKKYCDIIIPKGGENLVAVDMMVATIEAKL